MWREGSICWFHFIKGLTWDDSQWANFLWEAENGQV